MRNQKNKQNSNKMRAFRACRAILNHLELAPVTSDDVWTYLKEFYGVSSSTELTEKQMVMLEARFRAAGHSKDLLQNLISMVAEHTKPKLKAYDVITKGKETQYIPVKDVSAEDIKEWAVDRANEKGHPVHLQNADKVVVFRAEPSEIYVNPDPDGQISKVEMFDNFFMVTFNGSDKSYKYDKLNEYQVALCKLFIEHSQYDEMYRYLQQVRLSYKKNMADTI